MKNSKKFLLTPSISKLQIWLTFMTVYNFYFILLIAGVIFQNFFYWLLKYFMAAMWLD